VSGVDIADNPYESVNAPERHGVWRWAWLYADRLLELNIEQLAATWNNEDEAA
jgi:hypothetical protein